MEGPEVVRVTRQQLYDQVWSTPVSQVAKWYGLSDVGLAKVLKAHEVPRPYRGYWAKKRNGQAVRQTPRRPASDPRLDTIELHKYPERPSPPDTPDAGGTEVERPKITVAENLRGCHNLVSLANQELQGADTDPDGLLVLPRDPILEVRVSKGSLRRALLVGDAILKACEAQGYTVDRGPSVKIEGALVRFSIKEGLETKQEQLKEHDLDGAYDFGFSRFRKTRVPSGHFARHPVRRGARGPMPTGAGAAIPSHAATVRYRGRCVVSSAMCGGNGHALAGGTGPDLDSGGDAVGGCRAGAEAQRAVHRGR